MAKPTSKEYNLTNIVISQQNEISILKDRLSMCIGSMNRYLEEIAELKEANKKLVEGLDNANAQLEDRYLYPPK